LSAAALFLICAGADSELFPQWRSVLQKFIGNSGPKLQYKETKREQRATTPHGPEKILEQVI